MGLISRVSSRTYRVENSLPILSSAPASALKMDTSDDVDVTRVLDTFENLEDQESEYAKLLQFLESDEGQRSCYSMIEVECKGDDITAVVGRINNRIVRVVQGKRRMPPQYHGPNVYVRLGSGFTVEAAREYFLRAAYREEVTDENRDGLQLSLTAWESVRALGQLLPEALIQVNARSAKTTTIEITLNGKRLAKVSDASLHAAKHLAACSVLNKEPYKSIFVKSGSHSYDRVLNRCEDGTSDEFAKIMDMARKNHLTSCLHQKFAAGINTIDLYLAQHGGTLDEASKGTLNRLTRLTLLKRKKQLSKSRKRKAKDVSGMDCISYLWHMGRLNQCNPEFDFEAEGFFFR